jgi:hypothetical protein
MDHADASPKPDQTPRPREPREPREPSEISTACYRGVELAPTTLESLVTWDVSVRARREQDRLNPSSRTSAATPG